MPEQERLIIIKGIKADSVITSKYTIVAKTRVLSSCTTIAILYADCGLTLLIKIILRMFVAIIPRGRALK